MAIVAVQETGGTSTYEALATTSDVTAGNLLVVSAYWYLNGTPAAASDDLTKTLGTATIGTPTLDVVKNHNQTGTEYICCAIWSVPVTGSGSITLSVAGVTSTLFGQMAIGEYSGADTGASRLEDSDTFGSTSTTTPATPTMTSAGAALFVGALSTYSISTVSHTPDSPWATVTEEENSSLCTGALSRMIVSSGTSDAAGWTLGTAIGSAVCGAVYKSVAEGGASIVPQAMANYRMRTA